MSFVRCLNSTVTSSRNIISIYFYMLGYIGTTTFISSIGVEYLCPRCIHIHIDARNIYIFDYVDLERLIFLLELIWKFRILNRIETISSWSCMLEQKLILLLKIIIGFDDTIIAWRFSWLIVRKKSFRSNIDVNLKYQMHQEDHDANGQWISFLFEFSFSSRTQFVFAPVIYGEVIPSIVRIAEFKEVPSVHAINCKINWKFA